MTLQNIICGAIGGWAVLGVLIAPKLGRAFKHADPGEQYEPPPTPQPDPSWIDSVSVDALSDCDPAPHDRFDAIVTGPWFDGAIHYTGHGHEGGAL